MNFFKSVFADEEEEPNQSSPPSNPQSLSPEPEDEPTWGFMGGLIKTLATKSESVIETYRRDLQEFSTGLKKETQVFKDVASSSLEVGASKAQESLESVGQAFDSIGSVVWKSTAQMITQGDEDGDGDGDGDGSDLANSSSEVGKYSRFEAQLRGIQTFVEEPEDVEDYAKWKQGFNMEEKREEIEGLTKENGKLDGIYKKCVPNLVDHEVFWCRYYYRVYKLEQAESVRAKLVERAKEDEDLSWDVDDDDDDDKGNVEEEKKVVIDEGGSSSNNGVNDNEATVGEEVKGMEMEMENKKKNNVDDKVALSDEKAVSEVSKDSDISVVSSQPSSRGEEEDLGWDEIEDLGSEDEDGKKGKQSSSPSNREELRKRLSVAEEDEDLSWDIEDDDEPIKKS